MSEEDIMVWCRRMDFLAKPLDADEPASVAFCDNEWAARAGGCSSHGKMLLRVMEDVERELRGLVASQPKGAA